ncbi:MAG: mechanosensitive ion channel family protein [Aliishimia sp.]
MRSSPYLFRWRTLWLVALFVLFTTPHMVTAQAGSLFSVGAGSGEPDLAEIIEQANDHGLGVIVIDPEGNVLSPVFGEEAVDANDIPAGSSLMSVQESANAFRNVLFDRLSTLPQALEDVATLLRAKSPNGTLFAYTKVLILSLLLFGIGMIFEHYVYGRKIAARFVVPRVRQNPQGYAEKMPFLAIRFVAGVIGVMVSMAVAYAIGFMFYGPIKASSLQYTATLVNVGYFATRVVAGLWRMILSPYLTQYRIPHMSDACARKLHLWLVAVVSFGIFSILFGGWVKEFGLNAEVFVFIAALLGFATMLLNFVMVLANRVSITAALLHGMSATDATWPMRLIARIWVPLVLAYMLFAWLQSTYDLVLTGNAGVPLILGAYVILTVVLVVYGVINYFIERGFARARAIRMMNAEPGEMDADEDEVVPDIIVAQRNRLTTFEGLAQRVAGILAIVAGFVAFLNVWRPDASMVQDSFSDRAIDIIVIVFIGYISYNAFRIWIDAKIREEQGDQEPGELGDEGGGSSASRLATLLPLFRNFVLIVIVVTVGLIILMELGVNVGPLFAGAGIVGVAVGFGSQSLVRDIFSGAFFLFDDAFRKGEYIEIGDVKGTVENISVRSFQLRHHLGKLHTIPFGEIQVLSNYSRDWVMMKLPLRVTYDTDVENVRKLIKKLGQRLLDDPVIGNDFIQPLKSQGVIEMQDSAMIIRVKFMTKPGDQWIARKRVYEEIRALFEREGIKFAHREVTVRLADGERAETLTASQKEAVMAAAEASLEEDLHDASDIGDNM